MVSTHFPSDIFPGCLIFLVSSFSLFWWVSSFSHGVFFGPLSIALAEQFPAYMRSTGLAIAYNVAVMLFGGFAQFFVTWLIKVTGSPVAPVTYVMFDAVCGLLAIFFLKARPPWQEEIAEM